MPTVLFLLPQPELQHSMKSPSDLAKVLDAEWAGSDRPVLATDEGCIHMTDLSLRKVSCQVEDRELPGLSHYTSPLYSC